MAREWQMKLTDDLDGTDIATGKGETVVFGLDGRSYEIDLNGRNAAAFRKAMERYVEAARTHKPEKTGAKVKKPAATVDARTVKEWARSHGYEVSDRGRVPLVVRAAYEAATR